MRRHLGLSLFLVLTMPIANASSESRNPVGPTAIAANSITGSVIDLCFDKAIFPSAATNPANYSLVSSEARILSATLRPDLKSVSLLLDRRHSSTIGELHISNLSGADGTAPPSTNYLQFGSFSAALVGRPQGSSEDPWTAFSCHHGYFELTGGGSGWEGTNDKFFFVHEPVSLSSNAIYSAKFPFIDPKGAVAGLMIREDLATNSPFVAISISEVAVDDSSNTMNLEVLYRSLRGGLPAEVTGRRSFAKSVQTNVTVSLFISEGNLDLSWSRAAGGSFERLAEIRLPSSPASNWLLGLATAAENTNTTTATHISAALNRAHGDPGPPKLTIDHAENVIQIFWRTGGATNPYTLLENTSLSAANAWRAVTNEVRRIVGADNVTSFIMVDPKAGPKFYKLRG